MTPSDYLFTVRIVVVWFVGSHICRVHSFPNRATDREHIRLREDIGSPHQVNKPHQSETETAYYQVISKSLEKKEQTVKNCDDEEDCGSGFINDEDARGLLSSNKKDKEMKDYYEVISESMAEKDSKPSKKDCHTGADCNTLDDIFADDGSGRVVEKKDSLRDTFETRAKEDKRKTMYEIISKSIGNGNKSTKGETTRNCDDDEDCGSAVGDFANDKNSGGLFLIKDKGEDKIEYYEVILKSVGEKDNKIPEMDCTEVGCGRVDDFFTDDGSGDISSKKLEEKTGYYEVVSRSMVEKEGDSVKDAFAAKVPSSSSSAESEKVKYEIVIQQNGEKGQGPKNCDDEEDCGSAVSDYINGEKDVFSSKSKHDEEKTSYYQVISKTMVEKESYYVKNSVADTLSSESSSAERPKILYEVISRTLRNGDKKPSREDCYGGVDCDSVDDIFTADGSGDITEKKDSVKDKSTNGVSLSPSSGENAKTIYEIISSSFRSGHKKQTTNNCDDEEDCGSAAGEFISDEKSRAFPQTDKV